MKQINNFWNYFKKNHHLLITKEDNSDHAYETVLFWLGEFMGYYCPHLIFLIIEESENGLDAELIISANSDPDYYGEVITLVDAAPKIQGWKITAFIPPSPQLFTASEEETTEFIYPDIILNKFNLLFIPWDNDQDDKMILEIFCPEFKKGGNKKHWEKALNLYIQHFIGEINYGNHIAFVELALKYKETKNSIPLYELPYYIDSIEIDRRYNPDSGYI